MKSRKICLACDLKNDPDLIESYKKFHEPENVWPEVKQSILDAGIIDMKIYLIGNRLFMIMDVSEEFSPERKREMDLANSSVQEWEVLMWKFQQALPWAKPGEKWLEMEQIFTL